MTNIDHLLGRIHQTDCLPFMRSLPDKCVDLVLTDPPYGVGENYASFQDNKDNLKKLVSEFMPELLRIGHRVVVTCGVGNIWIYPQPTWILNWYTPAGCGSSKWGFCTWQPILVYGNDPYLQNGKGRVADTIVHTETAEKNGHPCPKPENLWSKLLNRTSVRDADIVFDPFMGSGTTALVAEKKQLKWMGCELEPKYCAIAEGRIKRERNQLKLFT